MAFCDPNPLASIAYASCLPHGVESPFESEALTSRAAYERLNRAAARAETLVLYRLDQLAGCRDSLDVDQTRLEASVQNLWRLTAVRKTLMAIEAALSAPTPTTPSPFPSLQDLASQCEVILKSISEEEVLSPAAPSAPAPSSSDPATLAPASPAPCESVSVRVSPCSSVSSSASSTASTGATTSIPPVSPSPSPQVSQFSSSLSIRAVPSCPRMSLSSVSRALDRINADMANYPEHVSTAADYDTNVTAEEFLRPSTPKSSSDPITKAAAETAAPEDDSPLLADPDLSPSLKTQIITRYSSPSPKPPVFPSSRPPG